MVPETSPLAAGSVPEKLTAASSPGGHEDPWVAAFCSPQGPEIFHSVAHRNEIWKEDPYDVETIHDGARAAFQRLLNRATTPPGLSSGRILLLLGESGSGKTHVIRAFRNQAHGRKLGYCGYLQMTSATNNYGRYVLSNLIDSLDQPYFESEGDTSGLMRLANAVAELPGAIPPVELTRLREGELDPSRLARAVNELADQILSRQASSSLDVDLIRALLYLQRADPRIKSRISKYLRCEDLSEYDQTLLGGTVPRKNDEDPQRVVELLGRLMWEAQAASLVICLDQLEEMYNLEDARDQFRRAMATVCALADRVPSSVLVISCLDDFYQELRGALARPLLDRIESDPQPIRLKSHRSEQEIEELIARRLQYLYESFDVPLREAAPTFPFPRAALQGLTNLRTRDVLDWCREYRNRCIDAGGLVDSLAGPPRPAPAQPPVLTLEQAWNDFHAEYRAAPPEDEVGLAALLAWAVGACSEEMQTGRWFSAETEGRLVPVEVHGPDNSVDLLLVGVCNKGAQGGHLGRQIKELEDRAGEHRPIIVRSTGYPRNPRTEVGRQIGQLVARGGRRVVVEDSDWRTMAACQAFRSRHEKDPQLKTWLREEKPLTRLKSLRAILDLDSLRAVRPPAPVAPAPQTEAASATAVTTVPHARQETALPPPPQKLTPLLKPPDETGPLAAGTSGGRTPVLVTIDPQELTRHAAFLGGSGSGKTTIALNIIEQLLLQGIPAVLIDRKGDLCGYAREEAWSRPPASPELAARRDRLRQRVEVALFTPGNPGGKPLAIPIVPGGTQELPSWEREQVAGYAASALAGMMGYRDRGQDAARLAILRQAVSLLSSLDPRAEVTVDGLIQFISEPDPALLAAIGQLDAKLLNRLAQDLQALRLNRGELLSGRGERLDTEKLLGLGPEARPGKTRLTIISTKFLGDNASIEFWVSQLLLEVTRWASKNPSPKLQAVFLFDEADMYLPAQRRPATKEPMENLLKRARSAGLGLLLASQNPGDFDYKCRDNLRLWLLGRITQPTSLAKMRPMLSECRIDIASKLPGQQPGEFHLVREGEVTSLRANRSFMTPEQLSEETILDLAQRNRTQ